MTYHEIRLSKRSMQVIMEALQLECNLALYEEELELAKEYAELKNYFEDKLKENEQ